jgi:hypothetical protein
MVDLDSSPTKLLDVVRIGKQLLMTRGALTTFSIANDVSLLNSASAKNFGKADTASKNVRLYSTRYNLYIS